MTTQINIDEKPSKFSGCRWLKIIAGLIAGFLLLMLFVLGVWYVKWQSDNKIYQNNPIIQSFRDKDPHSNVLAIDGLKVGMKHVDVNDFMYKHGFSQGVGNALHLLWAKDAELGPIRKHYGAVTQGLLCGFSYTLIVSYDEIEQFKKVTGFASDTGCV